MSSSFSGEGPVIGQEATIAVAIPNPVDADLPSLPAGFPTKLDNPMVWTGATFKDNASYLYQLTASDLADLDYGLAHFKSLGLDGDLVSRDNFPLKGLGTTLDRLSCDVHSGKGFCALRGIDADAYSVEDLTLMYLGVQSYMADQRGRQDKKGNMLVHVVADNSTADRKDHHRHSNKSITFHTEESGDVVSWLTRGTASSGGKCIIASWCAVYNILAANQPGVIRTLAKSDWPFSLPRFHCRPVLFHQDGNLIVNFGRAALVGTASHPRSPSLPALTLRQIEALNTVEVAAQSVQMEFKTLPGDMHFINNLTVMHRRDAFVDGQGPTGKRHLVRMRLRSSKHGWNIPKELQNEWERAFADGNGAPRVWHPEPMPDAYFPLRKYPN